MDIRQLTIRLEIGMLSILIDLLSDSRLFQDIFRFFHKRILPELFALRESFNTRLATGLSLAGLVLGFLIGFFISLV